MCSSPVRPVRLRSIGAAVLGLRFEVSGLRTTIFQVRHISRTVNGAVAFQTPTRTHCAYETHVHLQQNQLTEVLKEFGQLVNLKKLDLYQHV